MNVCVLNTLVCKFNNAKQNHTCILKQLDNIECNPLFQSSCPCFGDADMPLTAPCLSRLSPLLPPNCRYTSLIELNQAARVEHGGKVTYIRPAQLCHSSWKGQVCSQSLFQPLVQQHCGPPTSGYITCITRCLPTSAFNVSEVLRRNYLSGLH